MIKLIAGISGLFLVFGACKQKPADKANAGADVAVVKPVVTDSTRRSAERSDPAGRLLDGVLDRMDPDAKLPIPQEQGLRFDLNRDKTPEFITLIGGESWCRDGCSLVVISGSGAESKIASELKVAQGPVMVTETVTNGWVDLITTKGDKSRQRWKWDGTKYAASNEAVDPNQMGAGLTVFTVAPSRQAPPPAAATRPAASTRPAPANTAPAAPAATRP